MKPSPENTQPRRPLLFSILAAGGFLGGCGLALFGSAHLFAGEGSSVLLVLLGCGLVLLHWHLWNGMLWARELTTISLGITAVVGLARTFQSPSQFFEAALPIAWGAYFLSKPVREFCCLGRHLPTARGVAGPFLGLLLVCALFALTEEREFIFTGGNLKNILTQTVIVAIGALGMTLIIVGGGIDLSVGSVVAFCGVLGAKLLVAGWSPIATMLVLVAAGCGIGLVNGAIVAGFRMMPFIVTLGMMGIVRGAAKWLGNNQTVNAPPDSPVGHLMARVNPGEFWPLPWGVWIVLGLALVMAVLLRRTVFGRHVFAIGANETAARYSGVRVARVKLATYAIAGLLFGFAGLLQMSRLTQGDPTVAIGLELDIIAAVVIGGASLNGGAGSILGSMIGALIMALLRNGTNQLGWQTFTQEIIIGVVIVLAVGLDRWRQARR